jgi:hypothetical protein
MTIVAKLTESIRSVCPIVGASLKSTDKRTAVIDYSPEATPAQRAAAQAILDQFDPIAAQAEVEAEEAAELTRAEKLHTLAEWLRTQTKDVREKFQDIQPDLNQARAAIISDRAAIAECVRHTKDIEEKLNLRFGYTPLSWELPT